MYVKRKARKIVAALRHDPSGKLENLPDDNAELVEFLDTPRRMKAERQARSDQHRDATRGIDAHLRGSNAATLEKKIRNMIAADKAGGASSTEALENAIVMLAHAIASRS